MKSNTEFVAPETFTSHLHTARVQIAKGAITQTHSHENETIILVLEGICRFRIAERVVTLKKDGVLRVPAREFYSAEALADTIALKIATVSRQEGHRVAVPHYDPDQYLWGV